MFAYQRSPVIDSRDVRTQSATTCDHAVRLLSAAKRASEALRETLLRYGVRSVHVIRGGSEASDDQLRLRRLIATHSPVPLHIGPSAGARCMFCRDAIVTGALQYEIKLGRFTIIADDKCYGSFVRDIVEAPPSSC